MRSHPRLILSALLLAPSGLFAAGNLQLPPDLVEVLPISKAGSYMGDAVRIVDCPLDKDNPFGTCGNVLMGGVAMYDSHLSGYILIKFYPPLNNISHFEITVPGNLVGDNAIMRAPQWYQYPVAQNYVFDALGGVSSGDLNLITGEAGNLNFNFNFFNTFYIGLAAVNPSLRGGPFAFPGPAGSAKVVFTQRQDGALDFTLYASTFLPLGNNISGDPVRLPLPFSGPSSPLGSFEAPGLSLHPHIRISTTDPGGVDCGAKCPDVPFNTVQVFTLNSQSSYDADRFSLNIPQLGAPGTANARSHMQGRLQIQFGERSGDTVPFALSLLLPEGLLANPPASPFPLPPGFSLGTLGHDEDLHFPGLTYHFSGVVMSDDNFDISVGAINLKTGEVVGELLYKGVFVQTLLIQVLLQNNGRIPAGSFEYRGPASFEKGPNGELVFRFIADNFRPFDGFIWPSPDFTTAARSFLAGPGSQLNPRMLLQGMRTTDTPRTTKSGSATNVLSSVGDRFNYSYTIPCDPAAAKTATFEYTNSNARTGGTFKMSNPASVSCINSRQSTLPSGDYDVITLSGFGTWSKDDGLHLVNFQVSTTPGAPYVTVMIDAGTVSQANTPPAAEPIP